jgi:hypothetical protein
MLKTFFTSLAEPARKKEALQKALITICLLIFSGLLNSPIEATPAYSEITQKDDPDKKSLLNGRIWWNKYSKAVGDPYFIDASFLKGSVVFNGKLHNGLDLKFDIANDELLFTYESHPVICLNKEMVDSFTIEFQNRTYNIFNAGNDTSSILRGYVNLLYNGPSALYVKYTKKIYPLAVDGRYDLFAEEQQVFIKTVNGIVLVKGKRQLFNILKDKKKELSHFMRDNKLKCSIRNPESITPVAQYYDKLKKMDQKEAFKH